MTAGGIRHAGLIAIAVMLLVELIVGVPPAHGWDFVFRDEIVDDPRPELFSVCHGFTCALVTRIGLTTDQWNWITAPVREPAPDAESERRRIAAAIGRFEVIVGEITGTADDRPENGSGTDWSYQMDCQDESANTTSYLRMLLDAGMIRWHRVSATATRGYLLFGMPHTTAVIDELKGGARWAVDSWFFENGVPPVIVPLGLWRSGWRPTERP